MRPWQAFYLTTAFREDTKTSKITKSVFQKQTS